MKPSKTPVGQKKEVREIGQSSSPSSSSSLVVQNRFSPLAKTPINSIPSYSQLVQMPTNLHQISPSKNFISLGSTKFSQDSSKKSGSTYITNPNKQMVKILEPSEVLAYKNNFSNLIELAFPKDSLYVGCKPREYYEAILADTGSINITHIKNPLQKSPHQIDYSKAHIFKILSQDDWGLKPFTNKTLSNYPQIPRFNYYDYQDAWYNVFYLRCFSHSWFIFFDKNFDFNHGYPEWMIRWFLYLGNILETFPNPIKEGFQKFQELYPQTISKGEYLLQFTILFKIPWIFTWKFIVKEAEATSSTYLYRQGNVKWWDKLPEDQMKNMTIQGVVNYFRQFSGFGVQTSLENTVPTMLSKEDDEELQRLLRAPTQEEMRKLFQEIKNSGSKSQSSSPSSSTQEVVQIKSQDLSQDAQDPYSNFSPFD